MKKKKTHKKRYFKKSFFSGNISFRGKMLLIYIIGGIIPFLFALFYTNSQSRKQLLEQNESARQEEISLLCSFLEESMYVAEDVAEQIYNDQNVREILNRINHFDYQDEEDFEKDCSLLNYFDKYKEYYEDEISDIKIYVVNKTSESDYITYVDGGTIQGLRWYLPTTYRDGETYWSYDYDSTGKKKLIQLSRAILGESDELLGILAVQLDSTKLEEKFEERSTNTVLYYEDSDILLKNFSAESEYAFLIEDPKVYTEASGCISLSEGVREYLVTYEKVYPDDTSIHFTLMSVQNYQELLANITESGLISVVTVLIGLLCSFGLIMAFSTVHSNRINKLLQQMHLVATGEYDKVQPITGNDEIALIFQELEKMKEDIRDLTARMVEERVQKEKMHTKQKEVEFKMLSSQINPHFLYNTLETIRMKAKMNHEPEIEELVKMLAKIMRRNIQIGDSMVTLQSEIELIQNYLVIQNFRFGDRIRSEVVVDDRIDTSLMVVPLIMQPFVENAYAHGLEGKDSNGLLEITLQQQQDTICIRIKDNGAGIPPQQLGEIKRGLRESELAETEHIGISNVNQRLKLVYGDEYGVSIDSVWGEGTCVTILFPAKPDELA
ncbi:MAG: sensor histidine kinase [Clostridiaceae bacterium]|nr:sensor histidine kinase [Clostridiaceae bacterium]